jgi:predicted lactoylglutathione lyase
MLANRPRKMFVNLPVRDHDGHHWEVIWMDSITVQ